MVKLPNRQRKVRKAILSVGGYWRPIAGVARLLEELGELGELLRDPQPGKHAKDISEELADIWIISACTANQFNLDVESTPTLQRTWNSPLDCFYDLTVYAGHISRAVNYYDGPKTPRSLKDWHPLGTSISYLHGSLSSIANYFEIDLHRAVDHKLELLKEIDRGRYPESFDPSTAKSLWLFDRVRGKTKCPFAKDASIWGAPLWNGEHSVDQNIQELLPYFLRFAKASVPERIDAFVICNREFDQSAKMEILAKWFRDLLEGLLRRDPKAQPLDDIAKVGWQFTFYGVRFFILVFSPLYPTDHVRHSRDATFVVFQPEISFDNQGIGSNHVGSFHKKQYIRQLFRGAGFEYPDEIIDARVEAAIYLLPRWQNDVEVRWWLY